MAKKNEIQKKPNAELAKSQEVGDLFGNEKPTHIDVAPPMIKILREAVMFEMPNGQKVEEFTGHILYYHYANQYYATAFEDRKPEDSLFPTCLSTDGIRSCESDEESYDRQSVTCSECAMNQYGSDPKGGKGKACQNTIRLAILLDDTVVPCLLKAPPSSLNKKDSLKSWLVNAPNESMAAGCGDAYQVINVKFSLVEKNFDTTTAAALVLETVKTLNKDDKDDMASILNLVDVSKAFKTSYLGSVEVHMANEGDAPAKQQNDEDDDVPV